MSPVAVTGADLITGDIVVTHMPDDTWDVHVVTRIDDYPGRYCGGHARVAHADGWEHTYPDTATVHVVREG